MRRGRCIAVASLALALACTKKNPQYCAANSDCPSLSCNVPLNRCNPADAGVGDAHDGGDARDASDAGDGGDAGDGRDASDAGDGPYKCKKAEDCVFDGGGFDGSTSTVCEVEAGACVECVADGDCAAKQAKTPICQAHACRACKTDAECPDPNICMTDGHCATAGEVVFVEAGSGCPSADGSTSKPYCTLNEGVAHLDGTRGILVVRGGLNGPLTISGSTGTVFVVGKQNSSGAAQIGAGVGTTAVTVSSGTVSIRDLSIFNGGNSASKGIVVTGSTTLTLANVQVNLGSGLGIQADTGAQLTMDRCSITGNDSGGILINGAGYNIQNTIVAANMISQVQFAATANPATSSFRFNTVVAASGSAAICDPGNKRMLSDSIVIGGQNCTLTNSVTTAPTFKSSPAYHLTAPIGCPGTPATPLPDHDIDGDPRTPPLDCGADQFQ